MKPYTGSVLLPTQIRDLRGAGGAIADAKNKFMDSLPPPQHIPLEIRCKFMSTLDAVMDLANVMEPNLHKMYLLVDKEKLDEMIGIIVYSQIQRRMCEVPPTEEPQFIMTYDDAVQSLRILTGIERVFSAAIAWTASEEGTRHRKEMNRAHAAMEASFDRWLDATLPQNLMDEPPVNTPPPPLSSPLLSPLQLSRPAPSPSTSRRPTSLRNIIVKPLPDTPFLGCDASPYPVMTPPPLSPLCRYRHGNTTTCRYCHNIPQKPRRTSISRLSAFLDDSRSDSMPPRKRPRSACGPSEFATLVLSGSPHDDEDILLLPSDSISVIESPPASLRTMSSSESSAASLSPITSSAELDHRPLLPVPLRRRSSPPSSSRSKKTPFWLRVLKEFLPFL
ncbi:hypothetical protein BC835DRAFT_1421696 [Cytidiella melzeri]|nr:hypothetical protein BC835DRAFT_1421696 [Cytidiella melzeri]